MAAPRAPARLLRRPTACSPCFAFHARINMECLDIPAEEVVAAGLLLGDDWPECRPSGKV